MGFLACSWSVGARRRRHHRDGGGVASATDTPTGITFSTQPGDGDPASPLGAQPQVTLTKSGGGAADSSDTVALTLQAVDLSGSYVQGALSCTDTSKAAATGVVTFAACAVNGVAGQSTGAGKYTLTATDTANTALTVVSAPFYISGPAQLVFDPEPTGGTAGTTWGTQPVVKVKDAHGVTLTSITDDPTAVSSLRRVVGVAIKSGTGADAATLGCSSDLAGKANVKALAAGVATYSGCKIDKAHTGYQLFAVDPYDHLVSALTTAFAVASGSVDHLAFTTQPSGSSGGTAFTTQPVVTLQDAGNNTVVSTHTVTLSVKTGPAGGTLSCTDTSPAAVAGVATFAGCRLTKAGSYVLTATDSADSKTVDSLSIPVAVGPAAQLSFGTQPTGAVPGTAFTGQPVVRLTDAGGNPVLGTISLAITSGTGTAGAALACTNNAVGTVAGAATFAGCAIDKSGDGYTLTATSGAVTAAVSSAFSVTSGTAAGVDFQTSPSVGGNTGGVAFPTQPRVRVLDAGGQPASGAAVLSIEPGTGAPGAHLVCANASTESSIAGVATFSGCAIDTSGHGYRLRATLSGSGSSAGSGAGAGKAGVFSVGTAFDVGVGGAAQIAFTTQPSDGTGGVALPTQPVVTVEDAGGNPVAGATGKVTLGFTNGDGPLACQDQTIEVQDGRALFAGCSLARTASAYHLTASWNGHSATSQAFAVTAGPATSLVFTAQPGSAVTGTAFGTQPAVQLQDAGGNALSTGSVTYAITSGSGSGGSLSGCNGACRISKAGGGYALTATAGGLSAESLPFSVTDPPPAVGLAPLAIPLAQTFGGAVYGVNPTSVVDDVNTGTGSLTFSSTDLRVAGVGKPFLLARTYNSADTTGGVFGLGWSSLLDVGVTLVKGKTATVRGEDGQQTVWTYSAAAKTYLPPAGARGSLDCGGNGNSCRVTRPDGSSWEVNITAPGGGQLKTYQAADGFGLSFDWSPGRVVIKTDANGGSGRSVAGTIDGSGHLIKLVTPSGRSVGYSYPGGLLSSVKDTAGRTWGYGYTGGLLTRQTDADGTDRLVVGYAGGKVSSISSKGTSRHTADDFSYAGAVTTRLAREVIGGTDSTGRYTYTYKNNSLVGQTSPSGAANGYSYDGHGNLITLVDPLGFAQTLGYNANDDLISQKTPLSTVSMTYDGQHRILSRTDAGGAVSTYGYSGPYLTSIVSPGTPKVVTSLAYNNRGLLSSVTGPLNKQTFGYDSAGNRASSRLLTLDGAALDGPGTTSSFDEAGHRLTSTDANGRTKTWTYNGAGDMLTLKDSDGSLTTYSYNGAADLTKVVKGTRTTTYSWNESALTQTTTTEGHPTSTVYDASGRILQEKAGSSVTTSNSWDGSGRLVDSTDTTAIATRFTYDLANNPVLVSSSAGDVLRKQYDALNHPIREVLDGAVTKKAYDASGNLVSSTDPAGHVTTYTYTVSNAVKTVTTAAGTTTYGYDVNDNVTSLTDPKGHVTSYGYDAANRRTSTTLGASSTTFGYDPAGNVVTTTDPDGRKTSYTLDALNRAVKTTYSQGSSSFDVTQKYDSMGNRTKLVDPTGTHDYSYDSSGALTAVTYAGGTFSYDRSTPGTIVETYPDGTKVSYGVDDSNDVMTVDSGAKADPNYVHVSYLRNARRFTTGIAFSNGVLENRSVDQAGRVMSQSLTVGGTQAAEDAFTYDAAGERLTQVDNVAGSTTTNKYGYDGAGRLTGFSSASSSTGAITWPAVDLSSPLTTTSTSGVTPPLAPSLPVVVGAPSGAPTAYGYDANGNRTSTPGASYDGTDQLSAVTGKTNSYDRAGNLTRSGTDTFTYDAASRLVAATTAAGSIAYTYDGDGNRVSKTLAGATTRYSWDPASSKPQLALERTGAGALIRRYLYGEGPVAMQTPTATYFYHLDPQGSVMELTDSSGQLAAAYHYDGYGVVTATPGAPVNPLLFQSSYLDSDTGLYDMGARNYDPSLGRFTQRDPLERPVGISAVSSYAFVDDRPTVFSDPTGMYEASSNVFWAHTTDEANGGAIAGYSVTLFKVAKAGGKQVAAFAAAPADYLAAKWAPISKLGNTIKTGVTDLGAYLAEKLSSAASSAEAEIVGNIGEAAGKEGQAALGVLERSGGEIAELGGEAGAVTGESAEVLAETSKAAKFGGYALAAIGIGLQAFVTVEDCLHDTVTKCVADSVGLAVATIAILVCEGASLGSLTPVCGIVGGLLAVGLTEVISRYGPEIADAFVSAYDVSATWVVGAASVVADAVVTGFNTAIAGITSGFNDAIDTLVGAGYSALELGKTLYTAFAAGLDTTINALVGFG
ncbi:MAG: sle, partial [Frankiales bacterium]|nr:sle [Frankiales bacterium]